MNYYYYLFNCAYWVSSEDLKEKSAPQEYAFFFVFVVDVLLFVIVAGLLNLAVGRNLLNAAIVIVAWSIIAAINYLVFLRKRRYNNIIHQFTNLSSPSFKGIRVKTLVIVFSVVGLAAIAVATLNNEQVQNWLSW